MGALKGRRKPDDDGRLQVQLDWVTPADWKDLRSVRLRALADAPKAFVSEHSREACWLEEDWRSVIQQARWVVARTAHGVIGVARSSQDPESPERRYIEAVWVAPEFRRLGVGRRLVRWLIDRERKSGIKEILLWVIDSNVYARSFYFRMGFRPTGDRQPVPGAQERTEELLAYVIGRWGFKPG
jgi:ribosomal protein S18 acetylase RimI-like enzyme